MRNKFYYSLGLSEVTLKIVKGRGRAVVLHPRVKEWEKLHRHSCSFSRVQCTSFGYEQLSIAYITSCDTAVVRAAVSKKVVKIRLLFGDGSSLLLHLRMVDKHKVALFAT